MGLFDFFKNTDINDGLKKMQETNGAVLLDVRTRNEYTKSHIPGSINIPLSDLQKISVKVKEKDTPLFVHCLSGGRSRQAVSILKKMGYSDVTDIGGINGYIGRTVKGA